MAIIQQIYTLSKTILETGSVKTLYLTPDNGAVPEFIPGQFISIFFFNTLNTFGDGSKTLIFASG